jgi:hypothetical protein
MHLRYQRDRLSPGERGALARTVERRLAPGIEQIKALPALSFGPGFAGMHVDAIGATVYLRGSRLDQIEQRLAAGRLKAVLTSFRPSEFAINALYPHRHHLSAKVLLVDRFRAGLARPAVPAATVSQWAG